jgi:hypothetical protein
MYAAHPDNACDWFVTTDPDFTDRRAQLENLCPGLRIVTPSELVIELSLSTDEKSGNVQKTTSPLAIHYDHNCHQLLP